MYKILYYTDSTCFGGAEEYLFKILNGIDREKFNVSLICPHSEQLDTLIKELKEKKIEVIRFNKKRSISFVNLIYLLKLFRKAHVVHFNLPIPKKCMFEIICSLFAGVPIRIATIHLPVAPDSKNHLKARIKKIILKNLLSFLTVIIAVSETSKKQLSNRYNIKIQNIKSIWNGIDINKFKTNHRQGAEKLLGRRPVNCPKIAVIGRLHEQKGYQYLIEAVPKILKIHPSTLFLSVGDGPLKLELEELVLQNHVQENFIFLGHRNDIPEILSTIDILVLPSLWEGFPFVILEAMASSKPVIATNVDGTPEAVEDGKTGILVPPKDVNRLAEAIIFLLQNPDIAEEMGRAGHEKCTKYFSQERMTLKTQEIYESLIRKKETNRRLIPKRSIMKRKNKVSRGF